ncbi:ABC-ATPase domain-containing protein, partial [Planococcus sp. SIMBA_143]
DRCGQEILERTSVMIGEKELEVRFEVGMPAAGRKILGKAAAHIFMDILPKVAEKALLYRNLDQEVLKEQTTLMVDQTYVQEELARRNLVAFVANDSILPRKRGVSDR